MLVDAVLYRDGVPIRPGTLAQAVERARHEGGFVWAGLHDPSSAEIDELITVFDLHPLAAEDVHKARQRPKVERYEEWLFLVVHTARYLDVPERVEFGEIQMLCNTNSIAVIRHGEPVPLAERRKRLEGTEGGLTDGPVEVVHAVLDEVVDSYQTVLAGLDDDVSEVELDVFADNEYSRSAQLLERIYFLQREVLQFHRALHPLLAAVVTLRADAIVSDNDGWDAYFRDVNDHLLRQADQLHTLRELIAATLTANATRVSLRQNDDMRRISAWVAIAAVPTMIAGVYGMNFAHMPELDWIGGYPLIIGIMAVICVGLHRAFRRSGWL